MGIKLFNNIIIPGNHNEKEILIDIRLKENNQPKPIIIFVHGFKGFKDWGPFNLIADYFANLGYVYLKLNLSHNGTTPNNPIDFVDLEAFSENNFTIELDDIKNTIDYLFGKTCVLSSKEVDLNQIFMIGHSRGGGLAILKTHEDDRIKGLVTWAAVYDLEKRWASDELKKWKDDGITYIYNGRTEQYMPLKYQLAEDVLNNMPRFNIPHAAKNLKQPHLIIHGTDDETVPINEAEALGAENEKSELFIIEGANHTFGGKHPMDSDQLTTHSQLLVDRTSSFFKGLRNR